MGKARIRDGERGKQEQEQEQEQEQGAE